MRFSTASYGEFNMTGMSQINLRNGEWLIRPSDPILITGATGFIGSRVVESLLGHGFHNLRCFARPSGNITRLETLRTASRETAQLEIVRGNLLSREDCMAATKGVAVVYHLAAGTGEKSFPDAFMNSVVTTRNLLDACVQHGCLKRFVSISSFAVYSNRNKPRGRILDESAPVEECPELRGEAYCYAKLKQDQIVEAYGKRQGIPYVLVRPGAVYGPGKAGITGRVGIGTFGIFLHMGGGNKIPFTYVDNCAEAIVLAGLVKGVDGEVFNVVDDDLPSSRRFLRLYKREVKHFRSIAVPRPFSYLFCYLWEKYSAWSHGQLPPVFNRARWHAEWKGNIPVNEKIKGSLGWRQRVSTAEGLKALFASRRQGNHHA
jgi:nucleoside-diphosphate-sugar epimerase